MAIFKIFSSQNHKLKVKNLKLQYRNLKLQYYK